MTPAPSFRIARLAWQLCLLLPLLVGREAHAAPVVRSASGANAAAIQASVDQFRADLGSLNANVAGSFLTGRREINWDGVPDTSAAPNNLPADFFNVNSPRGVVFSTAGTGFRVSADSSNPSGTPFQFGDIDANYPTIFEPFSAERLFTAIGSNILDVTFFVPGTSIPATTNGFGVVFSDVDSASSTSVAFFDAAGNSLGIFLAPSFSGSQTFSFVGVSFNAGERVARVRITSGSQILNPGNLASDLVVMDDFIYGEPVAYPDVIAVDNANNALLRFNALTPQTIVGNYPVTGLGAGENLVGIDFRPVNGQLYGLAYNGSNTARLVTLFFTGGAATQMGSPFALSGSAFGFDFNPVNDRIWVTSDTEQNLSLDPENGSVTIEMPLNPGNPTVVGSAYSNNVAGLVTTQLFGIDSASDMLVLQNPPSSGILSNRGALGADTSNLVGFDIQGYTNTGYATLTVSNISRFFSVDLDDGQATQIGAALPAPVRAMALVPQSPTVVTPLNTELVGIGTNGNVLVRFNSDTPADITMFSVTGLGPGELIQGLDVRPANQVLYALGITNGPGTNDSEGRLYTINLDTGAATQVGNAPFSTALVDNVTYGFDFNPVTDRIRVVNTADQNMRVNPTTGFLTQFDTDLDNAAGAESVGNVAYDRNDIDPATATTLYAINLSTNTLEVIGNINGTPQSANSGILNRIGPLGSTLFSSVGGFDIAPSGHAFAALRVGTTYSLYSIDLSSGTAISRGVISTGTLTLRGLTVVPQPCEMTCPVPIQASAAPNQCSAVVNYPAPTTTGICGTITASPPSGSAFPVGTTTVNMSSSTGTSCSFTIQVFDTQPPSLTCPANITQQAAPGATGAVVNFPPPTVSDNCPGVAVQSNPPSGSFFPVGETTVTSTATDTPGNTATCSFKVTVTPAPTPTPTPTPTATPTATPGVVANVATRLPVGTGDNVLIEGFIVLGPNGSTKKIMVRALGPFLISFGIPDALPNPTLEIRDGSNSLVASNDDWKNTVVGGIIGGDQAGEIQGSGLAPTNDFESAIIADLAPGSYTAVVRGVNNTVGTGIVDAFDLSPDSAARLANVATRGLIQPGDQLMIAGFIIQSGNVRAVVRAIGPSLSAFGISNALPDTTLQLRDQNGMVVRENDDWETDQKADLEATGLQPSSAVEAALVETLPPGQYTAQVRGKPETTGIGVVQVFFLQ